MKKKKTTKKRTKDGGMEEERKEVYKVISQFWETVSVAPKLKRETLIIVWGENMHHVGNRWVEWLNRSPKAVDNKGPTIVIKTENCVFC